MRRSPAFRSFFVSSVVLGSLGVGACGIELEVAPAVGAEGGTGTSSGAPTGSSSSSGGGTGSSSGSSGTPLPEAGTCNVDDPAPDCVVEEYGVFVRAGGGGAGTRESPYPTLGAALAGRDVRKPFVFVCAGDYAEQVQMVSSAAVLVGKLDCTSWQRDASLATTLVGVGGPYTLEVGAGSTARLVDFGVRAAPGPERNAIAAWVHAGGDLSAVRTVFRADAAAPGGSGGDGNGGDPGGNGGLGTNGAGGSACGGAGGRGGEEEADSTRGTDGVAGGAGERGCRATRANAGADDCTRGMMETIQGTSYFRCGNGNAGAAGVTGAAAPPVSTVGSLADGVAWRSAGGGSGLGGGRGGAGGGGGQVFVDRFEGVGGSGGGGGCGGAAGNGGAGGGSSFAVLVAQGSFRASGSQLASANGGVGGPGGAGGRGGDGGNGANGMGGACSGAPGAGGGGGGGGAGGAGGSSAGIAFDAASTVQWNGAPITATVDALDGVEVGAAGAGGRGGNGGTPGAGAGPAGQGGQPGPSAPFGESHHAWRL